MAIEIRDRLAKAKQAERESDWDVAIGYYEQILNLLNWYKYQADFAVTTEQARGLIDNAKEEKARYEARIAAEQQKRIQETEAARQKRQRTEELRRMKIYLQMASDAYDQGEYDLAQAHAEKVLALDPRNGHAKKLIQIAKETKYISDRNEIREEFKDEWRTIMEELEVLAMPHPDILRYPKEWSEISQRKPKVAGSTQMGEAPDPRTDQIINTLGQKRVYDLRFEAGDIDLNGAIQYLRSVTGLNFVLSQKVKEEKSDTEIDLNLDNVSVKQVLNLLTEPNEMAWKVRNGVVMILDKEEALDKAVLQFYDVKDLVAKISDFPGQEINLVPSKYQPPEPMDEDVEPTSPFEVDSLMDVIRLTIEPDSWDTVETANIEPKNNVLVITTTPEIHRKIGQFLSDLRKNTGLLVSLEVRFLTAEDRFLRDVGVDMRGLGDQTGGVGIPGLGNATAFDDSFAGSPANPSGTPPGVIPEPSSIGTSTIPGIYYSDGNDGEYKARVENLFDFILNFDERGRATASAAQGGVRGDNSGGFSLQHVFLDDTQFEVILRAVEKSSRLEQISAPRLTVYDTQRANVSVMTQNSYVQDFDVEIAQAAAIGDPIIQTIRDGIILDVRPIVSADRRFITMELRPTVADLVRPIPTFQTSLATGPPVTIQVPELAISRVRTTVTMPDNGTLLLGGIKDFRDNAAESGIPILRNLPILSFFFGRKAKVIQRRNLLIMIKAQVVVPEEHAPSLGVN
jgi:type II secretory pathway component GspD/PulD (secretin)